MTDGHKCIICEVRDGYYQVWIHTPEIPGTAFLCVECHRHFREDRNAARPLYLGLLELAVKRMSTIKL
jgi:hypothetical protein